MNGLCYLNQLKSINGQPSNFSDVVRVFENGFNFKFSKKYQTEGYVIKRKPSKITEQLEKMIVAIKEICNSSEVMKDDKLLDNQDLAFLLKVSCRTLQRYRTNGVLPYMMIGHKTYYRASDICKFVTENFDCQTLERFNKETKTKPTQ